MNLPVTLLDKGVTRQIDDLNGFRYEVDDERVHMYFQSAASAGYTCDRNRMLTWCQPMPLIDGWHVQREELRRFGSTYVFECRFAKGKQEVMPTMFNVSHEEFIVLPILRPEWRDEDRQRESFTLPSRRWRAIVSFVSTLEPGKVTFMNVGNKLRGQLGEVRIGDVVLENRWDVEIDEFYSVVGHAILANELLSADFKASVDPLRSSIKADWRRHGPFYTRVPQYYVDLFSFKLSSRTPALARHLPERFMDRVFGNKLFHGELEAPYFSRRHYRLVNDLNTDERIQKTLSDIPDSVARTIIPITTALKRIPLLSLFARRLRPAGPSVERVVSEERTSHSSTPEPEELPRFDDGATNAQEHTLASDASTHAIIDYLHELGTTAGSFEDDVATPDAIVPVTAAPAAAVVENEFNLQPPPVIDPWDLTLDPGEDDLQHVLDTPAPFIDIAVSENDQRSDSSGIETVRDLAVLPLPPRRDAFQVPLDPRGLQLTSTRLINVPVDLLANVWTNSIFQPDGPLYPRAGAGSNANAAFYELFPTPAAFDAANFERTIVPVPDSGAQLLLDKLFELPLSPSVTREPRPLWQIMRDLGAPAITNAMDDAEVLRQTNGLLRHIAEYYKDKRTRNATFRLPQFTLSGVPSAAKSSVINDWLRSRRQVPLVVVPSAELRKAWMDKLRGTRAKVVTQHRVPVNLGHFDVLVIDEAFTFAREHLEHWLRFAASYGKRAVLIGDPDQVHDADIARVPLDDPIFARRRAHMYVANSTPVDAIALTNMVLQRSNLPGTLYQSRAPVMRSLYFVNHEDAVPDVNVLSKYRKDASHWHPEIPDGQLLAIGQTQGLRIERHALLAIPGLDPANWLRANRGQLVVAITRHTEYFVFIGDVAQVYRTFPGIELVHPDVVNGRMTRLLGERQIFPDDIDVLPRFRQLHAPLEEFAGLPLAHSRTSGETLVSCNAPIKTTIVERASVVVPPTDNEIQGFIYGRTNFDSAKDHEHAIDFIGMATSRLHSVGELSYPSTRTDMRNSFDDAHKLADVQVSQSRFEDLRNVLERQFTTSKNFTTPGNVFADAKLLFDRFVRSFVDPSNAVYDNTEDFSLRWISTRTPSFLQRLADEPFGTTKRSVTFHSFLKQQTKFKSTPGFAAAINYGQQIIANEASYSSVYGPPALAVYTRTRQLLRDGWIADIGLSDDELSDACAKKGLLAAFTECNVQIDVTRQDSSHTAEIVLAFCMWLDFCGFDPELSELYFLHCSNFAVVSQAEHLFSGHISFNLASGDPFTLIRNFFQFSVVFAARYKCAPTINGVEKGDDFIGDDTDDTLYPLSVLPGVASVQFKRAINLAPYHAGRFITPERFLVDPVRAFAKHFCRVQDHNVPIEELYESFISRATDYNSADYRCLEYYVASTYADFNAEEIDVVMRTVVHLRNRRFFVRMSSAAAPRVTLVDAKVDCAVAVAKSVIPGQRARFYHQFRGCTADEFVNRLQKHTSLPVHRVSSLSSFRAIRVGVYVSDTHAIAMLA